jgi:hypothetical protein
VEPLFRKILFFLASASVLLLLWSFVSFRKPVGPELIPITPMPLGKNWSFALYARDKVVVVNRDSRNAVLRRAGILETNSYDAGMTTLIVLRPGERWVFNVSVPTDTTELVVSVPCATAPAKMKFFVDAPQVVRDCLHRLIDHVWEDRDVHSSVWAKSEATWVQK